jgi:hypothetical protein
MQKTTKKIIAREFLYLLGTTIVFFIVVFIWIRLSERNYQEQNKLESEIEKLTEYENLPYRLKVFYYLNNEIIESTSEKIENKEKFISDLKSKKEASEIYKFLKEKQHIKISETEYLTKISKDTESEKYLKDILPLEKELEKAKNSFFNGNVYTDDMGVFGLILFSIFFLLRYLVYGTKWSIKQLKE